MKAKSIILVIISIFAFAMQASAGSFAPAASQPGSTAIFKDDSRFTEWATGCNVIRGLMDISNPSLDYASYGQSDYALGKANADSDFSNVVSLGDGGYATLTFGMPIANGQGYDFAVFENSFSDTFLELAFVEVSSDGIYFFRFDSFSETQTNTQVGGYGTLDPTNIYNLAGKYRGNYGTPFDLNELVGKSPLLDVNNIKYVKVVDVVGSINPAYASYDSLGRKINDPWKTNWASGGFDLDTVGVINTASAGFSLTGTVNLLNFSGDKTTVTGTIELNGTSYPLVLDADGRFTILDVANGTYDVRVKASHWLAKTTTSIGVSANTDIGTVNLINGDVIDNNEVDFSDINAVRSAYGSFPGDETWNDRTDVDGSGEVDFSDINLVRNNYGEIGD